MSKTKDQLDKEVAIFKTLLDNGASSEVLLEGYTISIDDVLHRKKGDYRKTSWYNIYS